MCLQMSLQIVILPLLTITLHAFTYNIPHHPQIRVENTRWGKLHQQQRHHPNYIGQIKHQDTTKIPTTIHYSTFKDNQNIINGITKKYAQDASKPENIAEHTAYGEDAASFNLSNESLTEWFLFLTSTTFVLSTISYLWFLPPGPHLGTSYLHSIENLIGTTSPPLVITALLSLFSLIHSGLATLRPLSEEIIGPRAHRVMFAVVSLPTALSCISYFVNHSHDGTILWDLHSLPGLHTIVLLLDFISFLLLYPSTFNLLEIAAVRKPDLHLYESGVIRITRHPQAWGQFIWCIAHCLWIGSSTVVAASLVLCLHHTWSIYSGDKRLKDKHGKLFDSVSSRTSIIPFAAIIDGRQSLPKDYWREWARIPYLVVVGGTIGAYFAHPWMMAGAALLGW